MRNSASMARVTKAKHYAGSTALQQQCILLTALRWPDEMQTAAGHNGGGVDFYN